MIIDIPRFFFLPLSGLMVKSCHSTSKEEVNMLIVFIEFWFIGYFFSFQWRSFPTKIILETIFLLIRTDKWNKYSLLELRKKMLRSLKLIAVPSIAFRPRVYSLIWDFWFQVNKKKKLWLCFSLMKCAHTILRHWLLCEASAGLWVTSVPIAVSKSQMHL